MLTIWRGDISKMANFGKNVSLEAEVIQIIAGYQNRTKKTFSATLNIIVKQWDSLSAEIEKIQRLKADKEATEYLDDMKKAQVVQ